MKDSKKLVAFKQSEKDFNYASDVIDGIRKEINSIGSIDISTNLTLDKRSSERQFLYALGILGNQIAGCPLLNLPDAEYIEKRDSITTLWKLKHEEKAWVDYAGELRVYYSRLEDLLDNDEKFQMMEYPVKK
jgi:hypothetical protein